MAPFLFVFMDRADESENGRQLLGERHALFYGLTRQRKAE